MDLNTTNHGYATYPSVQLRAIPERATGKKDISFVKELIFGDYIKIKRDDEGNLIIKEIDGDEYVRVRSRRADGYIKTDEIQAERVLEVNFVDVAQGDGCHVSTPDDEHFLIDAGKSDNMYRFISWRFNLRNSDNSPPPFTAVISHSDEDHYRGFTKLFTHTRGNKQALNFDKIYHNGMVEGSGKPIKTLGTVVYQDGEDYITDLSETDADFQDRITKVSKEGRYIGMLKKTKAPKEALWLGKGPLYKKGKVTIDVLGPVVKKINGKNALPIFTGYYKQDKGKTKNGHSVILILKIGNLKILLGGDLNSQAEDYLFKHYTGTDMNTASPAEKKAAVKKMNQIFGVDIAKSCHHGSPDFTSEFMEALNPLATVISSGDEESHCHPRPDTLGAIGKTSRGKRPLIFSTELARSTKEFIDSSAFSATKKKERTVTVYGMINVRSDGEKVIIAQKLEKPSKSKNWDIHKLEWNKSTQEFEYKSYYLK